MVSKDFGLMCEERRAEITLKTEIGGKPVPVFVRTDTQEAGTQDWHSRTDTQYPENRKG